MLRYSTARGVHALDSIALSLPIPAVIAILHTNMRKAEMPFTAATRATFLASRKNASIAEKQKFLPYTAICKKDQRDCRKI